MPNAEYEIIWIIRRQKKSAYLYLVKIIHYVFLTASAVQLFPVLEAPAWKIKPTLPTGIQCSCSGAHVREMGFGNFFNTKYIILEEIWCLFQLIQYSLTVLWRTYHGCWIISGNNMHLNNTIKFAIIIMSPIIFQICSLSRKRPTKHRFQVNLLAIESLSYHSLGKVVHWILIAQKKVISLKFTYYCQLYNTFSSQANNINPILYVENLEITHKKLKRHTH